MFIVSKVVGAMCAIYDTEDGSVEWLRKAQVQELIERGIEISGVEGDSYMDSVIRVEQEKLSGVLSGTPTVLNGVFMYTKDGKKHKFTWVKEVGDSVALYFTNGLMTTVSADKFYEDFKKWIKGF